MLVVCCYTQICMLVKLLGKQLWLESDFFDHYWAPCIPCTNNTRLQDPNWRNYQGWIADAGFNPRCFSNGSWHLETNRTLWVVQEANKRNINAECLQNRFPEHFSDCKQWDKISVTTLYEIEKIKRLVLDYWYSYQLRNAVLHGIFSTWRSGDE